ncbi:MAG: winged helix-turn-helix transcriptional regulator [Candidatus Woesearchaeota archaeon]
MDKLDQKLLLELIRNSRTPLTQLAKKIKASREVLNYRINKLVKDKVILEFTTEINLDKLGYIGAAVFIKVKNSGEKEVREVIKTCPFVSWVAEHSGVWNFIFSIYGKDNDQLDRRFLQLYHQLKEQILEHRFVLHRKTEFFYEKYVTLPEIKIEKKEKDVPVKIDPVDLKILASLSSNSRRDCVSLSQSLKITPPAIAQRIRKLDKSGVIEKYSLFVDVSKLGLYQYSVILTNKNVNDKERLIRYCSQHPKVSFIAEYVGDPFFELGIIVDDPYRLRSILQEIESAFPENRIMEVSLFQKEFISIGPPKCVFEK